MAGHGLRHPLPRGGSRRSDSGTADRAIPWPGPSGWALTSGAAGFCSGASLVLFFALARPFDGQPSGWSWLGPTNDLTSALQAGALIPVAVALRDRLPDDRGVQRWTVVGVTAMGAATVLPVLLVVGVLPFPVQAPLVTFCIAVMYGWLFGINRAGCRHRAWPRSISAVGMGTSSALAAAAAVGAASLLLPSGSAARPAAYAAAAVPAALAWLGFPLWTLLLRPVLCRPTGEPTVPAQ